MKKTALLGILFVLLLNPAAEAARGFGATYGTGTSDLIAIPSIAITAQQSVSFWFYANSATNTASDRFIANTSGSAYQLLYSNTGTVLSFQASFSTTAGNWTAPAPTTRTWHHFALIYDGSSVSNVPVIYIDGISQSVTTVTPPVGTYSVTAATYDLGNNSTLGRNLDGVMSGFAIWNNTLLTANEIKALASGVSPLWIRRPNLLMYAPMLGGSAGEPDYGPSRLSFTISGAKTQNNPPSQGFPYQ